MAESCRRRRIGQIVCRNINSLHGSDRALVCRCDSFLQLSHLARESWLISHGTWHTTQECGNFRSCLRETENVVDEEECFFSTLVAEIFGHCQCAECDAKSCAWRLIHLPEDHGDFVQHVAFLAGCIGVFRFLHFKPQIVSFACSLADASEHGVTTEVSCNASNHLLNDDGLADACTTEETDLSTADERAQKIDDLDACWQNFSLWIQVNKLWRLSVDRREIRFANWTAFINNFSKQIENSTKHWFANGNLDW